MTKVEQTYYDMLFHERTRFFLKWFRDGGGTQVFIRIFNMSYEDARKKALKLSRSLDDYCNCHHQEEMHAGRYKKSFTKFLEEPKVVAVSLNYIVRSLISERPEQRFKIMDFMASHIFGIDTSGNGNDKGTALNEN